MGVVLDSGKMFQNSVLRAIGNNLGLSWLGQIQSGRPYPLSTGSSSFGNGSRFFGAGSETQQRPNVLPDGTVSIAGIASIDQGNANFGPNAQSNCVKAGNPASECALIVPNTFLIPGASECQTAGVTVTSAGATCVFGPVDAFGDPVEFQLANGNLERNAALGSPFVKFDASLHKTFGIPGNENIKLELRFDAFNVFNHSNWNSFNSNDVLTALPLSTNPNCTSCLRLNGTFAGANGQILHISDLRHGKVSSDLANPVFALLGDPGNSDIPRTLQLSFLVRF
jgi:hypothetical protein